MSLTFSQGSTFFHSTDNGFVSFVAMNDELTRMVITTDGYDASLGQIYYYTRATSSDSWSTKIQIQGIPVTGMRWTTATMSSDGDKLVVLSFSLEPYVFKWINNSYVFIGTIQPLAGAPSSFFISANMNSNGSRLVLHAFNGYTYYCTWNYITNTYNTLNQTLDNVQRNETDNRWGNLAMSGDGSRIALSDYRNDGTVRFVFADWNGTNYGAYTVITALNGQLDDVCGGALSPDGKYLFVNKSQPVYGSFDVSANNFTSFTNIPSSAIAPMSGMYYVNIFTITHDGLHLLWNTKREDYTIKMVSISYPQPPPPPAYFGGKLSINDKDVSFSDADTYIKAPTSAPQVANKKYVDDKDNEIHDLILANANTDTVSTTQYSDLIAERQTVQSDLAIQIENLYQYFFNNSRTNTTLFLSILSSPLASQGCSLWIDGADLSVFTKSGSNISEWRDKSTNGYQFVQTNATKYPVYSLNSLNGKSTVEFSNMQHLIGPSTLNARTDSFSYFILCKSSSFSGFMFTKFDASNPNQLGTYRMSYGGGNYLLSLIGTGGAGGGSLNGQHIGIYNIFEYVSNRRAGIDKIYINGAPDPGYYQIAPYTPNPTVDLSNSTNVVIGGTYDGATVSSAGGWGFDGNIAEILVFQNAYDMTDTTRQQIEGYLAYKWGLQSKLPSNHLFKNSTNIRI